MRVCEFRALRSIRLRKVTFVAVTLVALMTFCMIFKLTSSELDGSPKVDEDAGATDMERLQQSQITRLHDQIKRMEKRIAELEASRKSYPTVQFRNVKDRKRILITGGAGFVGSHLTDRLMAEGHEVSVIQRFDIPGDMPRECRQRTSDT